MLENTIYVPMIINCDPDNFIENIKSTNNEKYIIYTNSLVTCIGLLFYVEDEKMAFSMHIPSNITGNIELDFNNIIQNVLKYIYHNNLSGKSIKYFIVPGYDNPKIMHDLIEKLNNFFKENSNIFQKMEYDEKAVKINVEFNSLEFAFNSLQNKFVTNKIFPNDPFYLVDKQKIINL